MKKYFSILILISLMFFLPVFSFAEENLVELLPDQIKETRFKTPYGYKIYDDKSLYDYLDGGAPFYIDKGFSKLINNEYIEGDDSIVVDIYMMEAQKSAENLFKSVKKKEAKTLKIGKEGQEGANQIEFYQDKYFVRITAFKSDQKTKDTIKKFAEATSKNIAESLNKIKKK